MIEPGAIVGGKYRIERQLGRGGMGAVYGATHIHLGTQVALKFLNEDMVKNPTVVERFMREARASALLKGEHVCRVFDVEREAGVPYIVMELLEGTDLSRRVKRGGPMSIGEAASHVLQACIGVAEAHAARIIHRDLKPGNLFLTERSDGTTLVKVLDFGVAKSPNTGNDFSLTQTANVMGSPAYMSPEQLRSSKVVDQRSDVWALGVILYELVIGKQPFRAETITDLAIMIATDPTPSMLGIAPAYVAVVNRCLEKDPLRRYQDVAELAAALAPFADADDRRRVDTVSRMLRGATTTAPPRMSNEVTAIKLPLDLAPPTERHPVAEPAVTTLRGASGVLETSPAGRARKLPWIPVVVASVVIGVGIAVIATRNDGEARPAASTIKIEPPAPEPEPPRPEPPRVEPPKPEPEPVKPEPPPAAKTTLPADDGLANTKPAPAKPPAAPRPKPKRVPLPPAPPKDLGESRI